MAPMSPKPRAVPSEPGRVTKKRRRIALACEECRDRKRKCDGVRPVCGACVKRSGRHERCVWNEDRINKGWSNTYVEGLQTRVRELEQALESARTTVQQHSPAVLPPDYSIISVASTGDEMDHEAAPAEYQVEGENHVQDDHGVATAQSHASDPLMGDILHVSREDLRPPTRQSGTAPQASSGPSLDFAQTQASLSEGDDAFCPGTEIDAMGVIGSSRNTGARVSARRSSEYFGPSSTYSLLSEACGSVGPEAGWSPFAASHFEPASVNGGFRASPTREKAPEPDFSSIGLVIPPRTDADGLLDSYWSWVHSLYPFLHRPSFEERYKDIWTPESERQGRARYGPQNARGYYGNLTDRLFYCLLNLVLALGTRFSPRIAPGTRETTSRTFFDRAKKLLDFDVLGQGSIGLVQTLLLMGQYLQSTETSSSCWNIVGLAIRVAQGIGLHHETKGSRPGHYSRGQDQLHAEMRRRTWTGCVLLDRVLSMTYGRPLMIQTTLARNHLVLPVAVDDQNLSESPDRPGSQPEGIPSLIQCYVEAIKLQDILGKVLETFYNWASDSPNSSDDDRTSREPTHVAMDQIKDGDLHILLKVDGSLNEWHRNLPPHLRVQCNSSNNSSDEESVDSNSRLLLFERQARVLEARYLHVRLTLLRPVLTSLCNSVRKADLGGPNRDERELTMRQGMLIKASNLCVSVAHDLVELISGNYDPEIERLPAPWYNVFYIFHCAIVLLIGHLCSPRYIDRMDESSLTATYQRCLSFLRGYESCSQSARRYSQILELVERQVLRHRSGFSRNGNDVDKANQLRENTDTSCGILGSGLSPHTEELLAPFLYQDNAERDPNFAAWMINTPDMSWLSFAPFIYDLGNEAL